ncbi:hypothetical protein CVT26_010779 [Gymnopilus dilepis]|uniref:DUF6593 domain-containing protein n=1 Tax=Gymnopilus dilepis TaxID=231916 RepID=A0A409VIE9_9AGAR|nr:hypothetical protein CVT26_010779 [Gymnopilus dilepis]
MTSRARDSPASLSSSPDYGPSFSSSSDSDSESWASTSTLVNPEPPLSLIFDRNSVISATLYSRSGPKYRITTNSTISRTELKDLTTDDQRVVATVKRRELLPDVVVFAHRGESVRMSKWLKRRKGGDGVLPTAELLTESGSFTWKTDNRYPFALYSTPPDPPEPHSQPEETSDSRPIAYSKILDDPPTIALVIRRCADSVTVEIITSFLVLEHRRRMKEKFRQGHTVLYALGSQYIVLG